MTVTTAPPFATTARGHALLNHILDVVATDNACENTTWNQGVYGAEIPTDAKLLADPAISTWGDNSLVLPDAAAVYAEGLLSFAGYVVLAAADEPVVDEVRARALGMSCVIASDGPDAGHLVDVNERATELLALTDDEAAPLLAAQSSLDDLRAAVTAILTGETTTAQA